MSKPLVSIGAVAALAAAALFVASASAQSFPRGDQQQQQLEGSPSSRYAPAPQAFPPAAGPQELQRGPGDVFNNGPDGYRDRDRDRDWDRGRDDWNRTKVDFQLAQQTCSRAGIQEAWSRGYYSAQYEGAPKLVDGRRGVELRGRMRLHDRRGYSYTETVCDVRRNSEAGRIEFVR